VGNGEIHPLDARVVQVTAVVAVHGARLVREDALQRVGFDTAPAQLGGHRLQARIALAVEVRRVRSDVRRPLLVAQGLGPGHVLVRLDEVEEELVGGPRDQIGVVGHVAIEVVVAVERVAAPVLGRRLDAFEEVASRGFDPLAKLADALFVGPGPGAPGEVGKQGVAQERFVDEAGDPRRTLLEQAQPRRIPRRVGRGGQCQERPVDEGSGKGGRIVGELSLGLKGVVQAVEIDGQIEFGEVVGEGEERGRLLARALGEVEDGDLPVAAFE
jgi:hypothetical protein